jgi:hypothetical protein
MKKFFYMLVILSGAAFYATTLLAQSFTAFSTHGGGNSVDDITYFQIVNNSVYVLGNTGSTNATVTNGSVNGGNQDLLLSKYSLNGNLLFATYLGGLGNETATSLKIDNDNIYIAGYTDSINYPVTNGSTFKGRRDVFVTRLNSSGNIVFSTYIGGPGSDNPMFGGLEVYGNSVIIAGNTRSTTFPTTDGSIYNGGNADAFVTKLDAQNGNILHSLFFGGRKEEFVSQVLFDTGAVYILGSSASNDLPITSGSNVPNDTTENIFVAKYNASDLSPGYSRVLGGTKRDYLVKALVESGNLYLAGYTESSNYPVTNGSQFTTQANDRFDAVYSKLNNDGNILFSTFFTTSELDIPTNILYDQGSIFVAGYTRNIFNSQYSVFINKVNNNGSIAYTKKFLTGSAFPNVSFLSADGDIVAAGLCNQSAQIANSNNSSFYPSGSGFCSRFNQNGNVVFSGFLGRMNTITPLVKGNNKFCILGGSDLFSYPVTNQSVYNGGRDNIAIVLNNDGSTYFGGYSGGNSNEFPFAILEDAGSIWYCGRTFSNNYPVTNNSTYKGNGDQFITKISFCPSQYNLKNDTLSPKTQTACKNGLGQTITGWPITVPADSLPTLFLNSMGSTQIPVPANYQWQRASTINGPFTNITGATFKDYTPVISATDAYFRRLSFTPQSCGAALLQSSDTVVVIASNLEAPVINDGGPFITCPGSPVTIGGQPTVSGGNPPYINYNWGTGIPVVANPVVSANNSTIYTLTVTDSLGCLQTGQTVVRTFRADAGANVGACAGNASPIGTAAIPGIAGLQYNWQPAATLNNSTTAQPLALPLSPTNYVLTLTVPKTGGGTCETVDTVNVIPVAAPITPNFAGADKVFCLDDSVVIGSSPETGFQYTWSPGSYLSSNTNSFSTYYAGNIIMPEPNPAIINVTAQKDGCSFPDQVIVATIEADAGLDGCGPRIIGKPDRTPNINETYLWEKISGSGNFTGPTNVAQTTVSESIGTHTTYRLTVTYNGYSCTDEVTVPAPCSSCQTLITVDALYRCASFEANNGNVTLYATSSLTNAIFRWTPQVGLSSYTGNSVQLTDNIPRIYTVTAINTTDTTQRCSAVILVNAPSFSQPIFPAPDTITCANQPVQIGVAPVSGYTYTWTGLGLSANLISNPIATITQETAFPVLVTDGNGCELYDTVVVSVQNTLVNGGSDWQLCGNGIIRLGTAAQPGTSYLWEPQLAPWQNNTNQFSAQPEVFVATNLQFFVTATTPIGCISKDTVEVQITSTPVLSQAPDKLRCTGAASVQIGNPALPGVTYQWSPGTALNSTSIAQPLAAPSFTTTYTVTATFPGNATCTATDQVVVVISNPAFSMPDISYCPSNGAVNLGVNAPQNMQTYNWQPASALINNTSVNASTTNPPPNVITAYTLQIVNPVGCIFRDTLNIIPLITAPIAGPDAQTCRNQTISIGSPANTIASGIGYSWSPTNFISNPNAAFTNFTPVAAGTYNLILTKTDTANACSSKDTIRVAVGEASIALLSNPTLCRNACVQIGTNPVSGIQYQWSPVAGLSNPSIANPIACTGDSSVLYTLTATDLLGCTGTAQVLINVVPLPAAQLSIAALTACIGDTNLQFNPVVLPAGNYSYSWTPNNGTLSNINILNPFVTLPGTGIFPYTLTVTDTLNGCSNSQTANLIGNICSTLATVGDFLWFDLNSDGLQSGNEPGVSGMRVQLYNNTGFLFASTLTDATGFYTFINVQPGTDYYVQFEKPAGYSFTDALIGGASALTNSKADSLGKSILFDVIAGASIRNIDAGIKTIGPVPVSLLSFSGLLRNDEVQLYWQTSSEYNNAYFSIERKNAQQNFTPIGRVNGHGTSSLPIGYAFTDGSPGDGTNFYRLKQVDIDGSFEYSKVIAIDVSKTSANSMVCSVNAQQLRLRFSKTVGPATVRLYANNGQLIKSINILSATAQFDMNLPILATGIYIIQVTDQQNMLTGKVWVP